MKVHVLGFWGTYPEAGEATTGFLLESGDERILLDCGSGVLAQLFHVCPVERLTGVVITHHHHDHNADLGVLAYALLQARLSGRRTAPLPMYMLPGPGGLMEELRREPLIRLHTLKPDESVSVGGVSFTFAPTQHPVPCLAVRAEAEGRVFAFSADSSLVPELLQVARAADLFICEASMFDGQEKQAVHAGHLTARQAGQLAREAEAARLALTHYPHEGDISKLVQQAEAAYGRGVERLFTRQVLEV
ncbi:MBL fold metallo-hydrolase [Alicyclobacillus kakegawensis]|uniref:MBL fold metallo-hydrolase n=1 Tax=Alicyclobacillus kakegawensis TaxID=392012 RepID=UPI000832896F|nr:MBL fold metallo-hydrolase [Alicyclobacillus kakegawensis]